MISSYFEWDIPHIPKEARQKLIAAASAWAVDNRFAPCEYRMCATIREYTGSTATVYISYDVTESVEVSATAEKGVEEIIIPIGPEAQVTFALKNFDVLKGGAWHSGCRSGA